MLSLEYTTVTFIVSPGRAPLTVSNVTKLAATRGCVKNPDSARDVCSGIGLGGFVVGPSISFTVNCPKFVASLTVIKAISAGSGKVMVNSPEVSNENFADVDCGLNCVVILVCTVCAYCIGRNANTPAIIIVAVRIETNTMLFIDSYILLAYI